MRSFAHILNPVAFRPDHPLTRAQAVTFAAMDAARRAADVPVEFVAVQYAEDRAVVPEGFTLARDLKRSILDVTDFEKKRKLPFLADLLQRGFAATRADYVVFTNIDIAPMPFFYQAIDRLIGEGKEAFTINRRTIAATPDTPDRLVDMYTQSGKPHPGHDCFVFPRAWIPEFALGQIITGVPWIGLILLANLVCRGRGVEVLQDVHLTFHLGDDQAWTSAADQPYRAHNAREAKAALDALQARVGAFDPKSYLGQHVALAEAQLKAFGAQASAPVAPARPVPAREAGETSLMIASRAVAQASLNAARREAARVAPAPSAAPAPISQPSPRSTPVSSLAPRSVAPQDAPRSKLIFCVNSGRSGSNYLGELLGTAQRTVALHEANPTMTGPFLKAVMERPLDFSRSARMVKAKAIQQALQQLPPGTTYAETNHMFIKTFHDVITAAFDPADVRVIILRRHLPKVLKSFINMGYFTERNRAWPAWMHIAPDLRGDGEARGPRDQYDLAISYLLDIEARAQAFVKDNPAVKILEVRLEELQAPESVAALFEGLGLEPTEATWALAGKPVNQRAARKADIGIETTLAYCEERLRAYLAACERAAHPLPALPQLAA